MEGEGGDTKNGRKKGEREKIDNKNEEKINKKMWKKDQKEC